MMDCGDEPFGADLVIATFKASGDIDQSIAAGLCGLVTNLPLETGIVCAANNDSLVIVNEFSIILLRNLLVDRLISTIA